MNDLARQAVTAAAAAAGDALGGKVGEKIADLVERLAGRAADTLGQRLAAAVRAPEPADTSLEAVIARWRSRNVLAALARTREILDARGVEAREVPASFLVPLLDEAGRVGDPSVREWWATLLANGVHNVRARAPIVIRRLADLEAEDLAEFRRVCDEAGRVGLAYAQEDGVPVWSSADIHGSEVRLYSLRLIGAKVEGGKLVSRAPTALGVQFRDAAMPDAG